MSDQPNPPDKEPSPVFCTGEIDNEVARKLEEQRRIMMEAMREDVAAFKRVVKGEPPPLKPSS